MIYLQKLKWWIRVRFRQLIRKLGPAGKMIAIPMLCGCLFLLLVNTHDPFASDHKHSMNQRHYKRHHFKYSNDLRWSGDFFPGAPCKMKNLTGKEKMFCVSEHGCVCGDGE